MNAEDKAQLQKVGAMIADLSEKLDALNWIHGEILGHLAAIGIVKGQPFKPDARMQAILKAAANAGSVTVKTIISKPRDERFYWYPGESNWLTAFPGGAYTWELDGVTLHNIRAAFHFYATGITPAMKHFPMEVSVATP